MNPYLSVIVAIRNDNYGGDLLNRFRNFLDAQLELSSRYALDCELIIVEWNPPENQARLSEALTWEKWRPLKIRIVQVSKKIHDSFPNNDRIPLHEYIAKNVGIRRASGDFILSTNPDLLYSQDLVEFIARRKLLTDSFYRVDRYDIGPQIPSHDTLRQKLTFCKKHVSRIDTHVGTIEISHFPLGWMSFYLNFAALG